MSDGMMNEAVEHDEEYPIHEQIRLKDEQEEPKASSSQYELLCNWKNWCNRS